jgi:hypothetical protein
MRPFKNERTSVRETVSPPTDQVAEAIEGTLRSLVLDETIER